MIEAITPKYKLTCDRCGKSKMLPDEMGGAFQSVAFDHNEFRVAERKDLCEACYEEFCELEKLFFDEANKEC